MLSTLRSGRGKHGPLPQGTAAGFVPAQGIRLLPRPSRRVGLGLGSLAVRRHVCAVGAGAVDERLHTPDLGEACVCLDDVFFSGVFRGVHPGHGQLPDL
ncbi:hypothetical protein D3C84_1035000 [compost metagenome]